MTHLTFERISELADARDVEQREPHLRDCADCRATLQRLRDLVTAAHALPRDIAPPTAVWEALRARLAHVPRARARGWKPGWLAAAAAIVFMAGTAILLPRAAGKAKGAKGSRPPPIVSESSRVVASVDKNYVATLLQLRETLDSQRGTLSPNTVRVVEGSLALLDTAIAEAREALTSDPANQALVYLLAGHYERKVDLLQRATELSPSF